MKILMAQLNLTIGDLGGNTNKILDVIQRHGGSVDFIVFPELAITGYPPLDLVEREHFIHAQIECLYRIALSTHGKRAKVVLGFVDWNKSPNGKRLFNSLALCCDGEVVYHYNKRLLPTYDIFDEARHFEPGSGGGVVKFAGTKVGFLICEDAWNDKAGDKAYPVNPVAEIMAEEPDFIISINASPWNVGKQQQREGIYQDIAKKYKTRIIYVNQVGANDDIIFDGHSFALNAEGAFLCNLGSTEQVLIFDTESTQPAHTTEAFPDIAQIYQGLVTGIEDYVTKTGAFNGVVVGCSGGIDSALVLALAVDALGADHVVAITMPSKYSSQGSWKDSETLCKNLGVELKNLPIENIAREFIDQFNVTFPEGSQAGVMEENLQARIRGNVLMAFSNRYGYLVLSTSNKSEASVGYTTIYGDMSGGLAPISDLYKTEVWELAKYYNKFSGGEIIPLSIINKEPSAELRPDQQDSDSLPAYPILDRILRNYIEGEEIDDVFAGYHRKEIAEVHKMVDRAEFKRRQAPPTLRVHRKAFGFGRRLPIVQQFNG